MAVLYIACQVAGLVLFLAIGAKSSITGWATCDNEMWLYSDGVFKVYNDRWWDASPVTLPDHTRVVGIKCKDKGSVAGIRAAFDNGVRTDKSWKCHTTASPGWLNTGFDDTNWVNATEVSSDIDTNHWKGRPDELTFSGSWIWTRDYRGGDMEVYCRKEFPEPSDSCLHTAAISDQDSCQTTVQQELEQLKQYMARESESIRRLLASKLEEVLRASQAANPEVLRSLRELKNTINKACNTDSSPPPIYIPPGCHCPGGRPTGKRTRRGAPGGPDSNLPPCPPGCAREPIGPGPDSPGAPGGSA